MNTSYATRFSGLLIAVLMTAAVNGAMLLQFDAVAQEATVARSDAVTLETVNIIARQS